VEQNNETVVLAAVELQIVRAQYIIILTSKPYFYCFTKIIYIYIYICIYTDIILTRLLKFNLLLLQLFTKKFITARYSILSILRDKDNTPGSDSCIKPSTS
jgi:hypothetical protein